MLCTSPNERRWQHLSGLCPSRVGSQDGSLMPRLHAVSSMVTLKYACNICFPHDGHLRETQCVCSSFHSPLHPGLKRKCERFDSLSGYLSPKIGSKQLGPQKQSLRPIARGVITRYYLFVACLFSCACQTTERYWTFAPFELLTQ